MNQTELNQYKKEKQKTATKRLNKASYPSDLKLVAEGDSWFDYTLRKDILDYLIEKGYAVKKFAKAGDTLENMIYGHEYKKENGKLRHQGPESFQEVLLSINKMKPHVFLFSGGGNDIVGPEVLSYLNHAHEDTPYLVNTNIFQERLKHMKSALEFMIKAVAKKSPTTQILMDGYDYAQVNGKAYRFIIFDIVGPWLEPSFGKKAITQPKDQKEIIEYLVDEFNNMLITLDNKYSHFHHIELRNMFPKESEWRDEIHLNNAGFKKVAEVYHQKICSLLNHDPVMLHKHEIFA